MSISKAEIRGWLKDAKKRGATHVLIVVDTFDYEDYPVEVKPGEDAHKRFEEYNGQSMQRVMEVYNLALDIEAQLAEHRAFNF